MVSQEAVRRVSSLGLALSLVLGACVQLPESTASGARPRPPPEPGSSITHSKRCACRACGEASCCGGDKEPDLAAKKACESSYEFSDSCGMQIASCASRCFERVWRVKLTQECDALRPAECCG